MISLDANGKQSSEVMELIKKFPTSAFVAGRASPGMWEGAIRGARTFPSVQTILPMVNGQVPKALPYRFLNYLTISPHKMFGRSPTLERVMGQYSRTRFQLDAFRVSSRRGISVRSV